MNDESGLRGRTVGAFFAGAFVLGFLVQRLAADHFGRLPVPSWPGLALVVAVGVGLLIVAWPIRRWRAGRLKRRLDPIRAFRTLLLARAAALSGAIVAGGYLALGLVVAGEGSASGFARGLGWSLAYAVGGGLLILVGLLVQSWCRLDPPPGDPDWRDERPDDQSSGDGRLERVGGPSLEPAVGRVERHRRGANVRAGEFRQPLERMVGSAP